MKVKLLIAMILGAIMLSACSSETVNTNNEPGKQVEDDDETISRPLTKLLQPFYLLGRA